MDNIFKFIKGAKHERSGNTSSLIGSKTQIEEFYKAIDSLGIDNGMSVQYVGEYRGRNLDLKKNKALTFEISFFTNSLKELPVDKNELNENSIKILNALENRFSEPYENRFR